MENENFDYDEASENLDVLSYSDPRYNSEIKIGERYYDSRYGDYYTITEMKNIGDIDVDVVLEYDKGKTRKEKGSYLLYHIDKKQHSLSKEQLIKTKGTMEVTNNPSEQLTEKEVEMLEIEPVILDGKENIENLYSDNWYKQHPEKILGMAYEASGRFGKVTKYKGGIDVLSLIQADESFVGADKALIDPLASVSNEINISAELLKPEVQKFVVEAIEESFAEAKSIGKKKNKKAVSTANFKEVAELNDFKTTFKNINSGLGKNKDEGISKEEVEVYTWYKTQIGKPLSKYYVSIFKEDLFLGEDANQMRATYEYNVSDDVINGWVEKGLLFFHKGELLPKFEYQSGNMYDKKMQLQSDKDKIVELYGQDIFDKQEVVLQESFQQIYDKRLVIGGENSLVVLAFSKLAKEFKISAIEDLELPEGQQWKILSFTADKSPNKGQPNIIKDNDLKIKSYKRQGFDEVSLSDAFGWWLLNKKPLLKKPISHLDIYKYYVLQVSLPSISSKLDEATKKKIQAQQEKLKWDTQLDGERLFTDFLATQLSPSDKVRLESQWNFDFNNYLPINLNKVPIAFTMGKVVFGNLEKVRPEKRDAVAFVMNNGTGVLSYDVGVGKTPSAIFTISAFLDAGYCKRPLLVLPNQVYRQFISELKEFVPHIPILEAFNLSEEYVENFKDASGNIQLVPEGTVTVMTYEGFEHIGFNDETRDRLVDVVYGILNQGSESKKQEASLQERIGTLVGKGLKGGGFPIESFGFDFMCYDEAHKMKKVFTSVKGEIEKDDKGNESRGKNPYKISSGTPSSIALKGFMMNYYVMEKNGYKNVLLLTATPFTNSPLEIFSMLAMVAYEQLSKTSLNNLKAFYDTYVKVSTDLVLNSKLRPEYKQIVLGFNNLISLQSLIRRYILYKTGEEVGVVRPKKYVLPYLKEIQNDVLVDVPEERRVETYIPMTAQQSLMMDDIISYVETGSALSSTTDDEDEDNENIDNDGEIAVGDIVKFVSGELTAKGNPNKVKVVVEDISKGSAGEDLYQIRKVDGDEFPIEGKKADLGVHGIDKIQIIEIEGVDVDEESLSDGEKKGVRTIKGINYSRNLALSPYLYKFSGLGKPNYKSYIENSPKLFYVMSCVKGVRDYNLANNEQVAGQVIYMDRGVQYFGLIKEYLVNECGFNANEIGIIKAGLPKTGSRSKENVKNLFNGEIYNEDTKSFEKVDDSQRIKVVIGSSTIKEGMNLQKFGAVLYNCFIDWNPTDIQQLEGRIYRQKNTFGAVRIVNPLVVDSADIFLFQKLQEKTARLNTIWATDGKKNVLNTDELNAAELKYALIRNPEVIAEMKIIEEKGELQSEILSLERQLSVADKVLYSANEIKNLFNKTKSNLDGYRNFEPTSDTFADANKLVALTIDADKNKTDAQGKEIVYSYEKTNTFYKINDIKRNPEYYLKTEKEKQDFEKLKKRYDNLSSLKVQFSKRYDFTGFAVAVRDMKKYYVDFINQYNIDFDINYAPESLAAFKGNIKIQIDKAKERIEALSTEENIKSLVREIIEEKERQKIVYKTIPQLIKDFSKLNFLLSDRVIDTKAEIVSTSVYNTCPPMEVDGKTIAITDEAIKALQVCLDKNPQTKGLYYSEKTGYTASRKKVHEKIINDLFEKVKCVKGGGQPIAIFTGGSPASGKSFFIKKNAKYITNESIFHLDADEIRSKLPEYKGWNANSTHSETQDIVNELLTKIGSETCRYDFIYDGTMNKAKKYFELINRVKALGYKVYVIFMEVPYEEAKRRAMERYQRTGRYVPVEVIDDFFTKVGDKTRGQVALDELKPIIDGYVVADGMTGDIITEGGEGIPKDRNDKVYGELVLELDKELLEQIEAAAEVEVSKKSTKEEAIDTIKSLRFLAERGNKDAIDTIKALKLYVK